MGNWLDLAQNVDANTKRMAPGDWLSMQHIFRSLTMGQRKLQEVTQYVKRLEIVTLDPNSTTGAYTMLHMIDTLSSVYLTPTPLSSATKVPVVSYGFFQDWIEKTACGALLPATPMGYRGMLASWQSNQLLIWPFTGSSGTLTVRYAPSLLAWAPSLTGSGQPWEGFTVNNLQAAMAAASPEPEYQAFEDALENFALVQCIRKAPDGEKRYALTYQEAKEEFGGSVAQIMRRSEDYNTSRRPALSIAGLI